MDVHIPSICAFRPFAHSVHWSREETPPRPVICGVPQGSLLGPIPFVPYSLRQMQEEQQMHNCAWSPPPLLCKQYTALNVFLHFRVDVVQPTQVQSFEFWGSMVQYTLASPSTWLQYLRPAYTIRNLGVHFDSCMTMTAHASQLVRGCFYQLRRIKAIRKFIPTSATVILVNSFIVSRIGYCKSILAGLQTCQLDRISQC